MALEEDPDLEAAASSSTSSPHSAADFSRNEEDIHSKDQSTDGFSETVESQDASEPVGSDIAPVSAETSWSIKGRLSFLNWRRVFESTGSKDSDYEYEEWQDQDFRTHPPGLPQCAALLDQPDYRIFRRFGSEHCMILLYFEKEIYRLSKRFSALNKASGKDDASGIPCLDKERAKQKRRILGRLYRRLKDYDDFLQKYERLVGLPSPTKWRFRNLCSAVFKKIKLDPPECEFFRHRYDLVHIKGDKTFRADSAPVVQFLQNHINAWPKWFTKLMKKHDREDISGNIAYISRRKVILMGSVITASLAMMILVTPMALLSILQPAPAEAVAIVIVFTLTFISLMSIAVGPKIETLLGCVLKIAFCVEKDGKIGKTGGRDVVTHHISYCCYT
ncbi:hypothetical protein F5884DRAFT_858383 [Xylogone sp. PMI_703]|nr:hypothetical protein F5884DRAFT_858383 [Xylogone sp. PMI_703]